MLLLCTQHPWCQNFPSCTKARLAWNFPSR